MALLPLVCLIWFLFELDVQAVDGVLEVENLDGHVRLRRRGMLHVVVVPASELAQALGGRVELGCVLTHATAQASVDCVELGLLRQRQLGQTAVGFNQLSMLASDLLINALCCCHTLLIRLLLMLHLLVRVNPPVDLLR